MKSKIIGRSNDETRRIIFDSIIIGEKSGEEISGVCIEKNSRRIFDGYSSFRCTFAVTYISSPPRERGSLRYTKNPFHLSKQQNVYLLRFNFKSLFIFNTLRQNRKVRAYNKNNI